MDYDEDEYDEYNNQFDEEDYEKETNLDKKNKLKKTPLERFYETVNAISRQLLELHKISDGDIKFILENIARLYQPDYKNATGYILGYIVSGG